MGIGNLSERSEDPDPAGELGGTKRRPRLAGELGIGGWPAVIPKPLLLPTIDIQARSLSLRNPDLSGPRHNYSPFQAPSLDTFRLAFSVVWVFVLVFGGTLGNRRTQFRVPNSKTEKAPLASRRTAHLE